jgi:hypothetical protein
MSRLGIISPAETKIALGRASFLDLFAGIRSPDALSSSFADKEQAFLLCGQLCRGYFMRFAQRL